MARITEGGFTGTSKDHQLAGTVHPGVYFISREVMERLGVNINAPTVADLHRAISAEQLDGLAESINKVGASEDSWCCDDDDCIGV